MELNFKIEFQNEIRRISMMQERVSIDQLRQKLFEMYQVAPLFISYKDEEGDYVTLSTEEELIECLRINQGKLINLRLYKEKQRKQKHSLFMKNLKETFDFPRLIQSVRENRRKVLLGVLLLVFFKFSALLIPFLIILFFVVGGKVFARESINLFKSAENFISSIFTNNNNANNNNLNNNYNNNLNQNDFPLNNNLNNNLLQENPPFNPELQNNNDQVEAPQRSLQSFQQNLMDLEKMGFANRSQNISLLVKHKGDLQQVISELLQN